MIEIKKGSNAAEEVMIDYLLLNSEIEISV